MNYLSIVDQFQSLSLKEISSVRLMNRIDQKFIFHKNQLLDLLIALKGHYSVLQLPNSRIQKYKSLYFDTYDKLFFFQHHNQRVNRCKVRFREYVDSNLVFLEIKTKNNKGKTLKNRIKVDQINNQLSFSQNEYIREITRKDYKLIPQHFIYFDRITLVNNTLSDRLTIDLNIVFENQFNKGSFDNIIIAEIKKDRSNSKSIFQNIAKKISIFPTRISKYCMSTMDLNKDIKYNRFKSKKMLINKLKNI